MLADAYFWSQRERIVAVAARHRLPAMYAELEFGESGGLMAYGPSLREAFRLAGARAGQILHGARAGDLPIERPAQFELLVNVKTAKALGLTIPPSLLARADQVIE